MKKFAAAIFSCAAGLAMAGAPKAQPSEDEVSPTEGAGLAAWAKVYEVFSHPRCANCHVPEDGRPRWSGQSYGLADGEWIYHGMNVHGGQSRIGFETLPCTTCHTAENSETPHGPPGSDVWMLAPIEMTWWEKSSQEICEQVKDPASNGGRTLGDIADHVAHDELVRWGWEPGSGRKPAPYTPESVAAFIQAWAGAGAPCPDDGA